MAKTNLITPPPATLTYIYKLKPVNALDSTTSDCKSMFGHLLGILYDLLQIVNRRTSGRLKLPTQSCGDPHVFGKDSIIYIYHEKIVI